MGVERVALDSHFFDDLGADSLRMAKFCAQVRKRDDLPSVSMKDIYAHSTIRGLAAALAPSSSGSMEVKLAEVFAEVVGVERVAVESHFFDDLGADSLRMAKFCAQVRKRDDLPSVSMKDVYAHPTIRSLGSALATSATAHASLSAPTPADRPVQRAGPIKGAEAIDGAEPAGATVTPVGAAQYVICGVLQVLVFLGYTYLAMVAAVLAFDWISDASGLGDSYLRAVVAGVAYFLGVGLLPILAKWALIGRWKPRQIRIWSLAYVRFWAVKTLIRFNPLVLVLVGSPLYVLYLRALGAKIGRGVTILTKHVPVCTDLLTVGDNTLLRKDAVLPGYRAHAGMIQIGSVTLGRNVLISESTVLDINTAIGDDAQLGMRSALYPGQSVPAGQRWHGSPAQPTDVDYRMEAAAARRTPSRTIYAVMQLLGLLLVTLPVGMGGVALLGVAFPRVAALLDVGALAFTDWVFYLDALVVSAVLFFGAHLLGLLVGFTLPRVLNRAIEPDRVYPLYGMHYQIHRTITRLTNRKFLTGLFGDSSYIVHYLRGLGYDLGEVVQTGSNFGTNVTHETPYLISVGSGTMVADGLAVMNTDYSSTSFRVSRASIGAQSFLGNGIIYPSQAKVGDNCLLATKVLVPIDGPVREGVGLLGSPSFAIPRSVDRDAKIAEDISEQDRQRLLAAKNRYNLRTMALVLLVRWINVLGVTLITLIGVDLYDSIGVIALVSAVLGGIAFTLLYGVLVERANARFRPLTPQLCSIYDPYFWWHERYWKLLSSPAMFNGTPMKGLMWRLVGVRVGRRLFDDGCDIPERTLVTLGDDCTLNVATWLQAHSQEDGAFKSDHITIGHGCTVGVSAWTHYGIVIGDGAELAADSFLMKGEVISPHTRWGGNPAQQVPGSRMTSASLLPVAANTRP